MFRVAAARRSPQALTVSRGHAQDAVRERRASVEDYLTGLQSAPQIGDHVGDVLLVQALLEILRHQRHR